MSRRPYMSFDGCGCCDRCPEVEIIGEVLMPDGKILTQVRTIPNSDYGYNDPEAHTYWIDPDLNILQEA